MRVLRGHLKRFFAEVTRGIIAGYNPDTYKL
jgi:hypothetical protein